MKVQIKFLCWKLIPWLIFFHEKSSGRLVITSKYWKTEPRDKVKLYHSSILGIQLLKYPEERFQSNQAPNKIIEINDELFIREASDDDLVQLAGQLETCFF